VEKNYTFKYLNDLYCSRNIIRVTKSRRMRQAGHVELTEGCLYRLLVVKHEGKRPLGRPRRRWRIILRWIFRKWDVAVWTGSSWLRIGTGGGNL
jgi:hypothetical protein